MGFLTTLQAGFSYLASVLHKRQENSLEDFYINRFGRKLYSMFFEKYTENLWGRSPREIAPDWGAQRAKGLSVMAIVMDMFKKFLPGGKKGHVETSLIEEFSYPKLGPGELWDVTGEEIIKNGGQIISAAAALPGCTRMPETISPPSLILRKEKNTPWRGISLFPPCLSRILWKA